MGALRSSQVEVSWLKITVLFEPIVLPHTVWSAIGNFETVLTFMDYDMISRVYPWVLQHMSIQAQGMM